VLFLPSAEAIQRAFGNLSAAGPLFFLRALHTLQLSTMNKLIKVWTAAPRKAERELEAAVRALAVKAAGRRLMQVKRALKKQRLPRRDIPFG
jgi:hypothetical protein